MSLERARGILVHLRSAAHSDPAAAKDLLNQFKIAMTEFPSQSASAGVSIPSAEESVFAREALELGVIVCSKTGDSKGFERNVAMLKPYYAHSSETSHQADARRQVLGLLLVHLLVENLLPQFHAEVELLAGDDKASPFIAFVLKLESNMAEGAYNKILEAQSHAPSQYFAPFVARLADTAREDIADCAAVSYKVLPLAAAQKMLLFSSRAALLAFLAAKRPDFVVSGDAIHFASLEKAARTIDAMGLLTTTLEYATDLERIV